MQSCWRRLFVCVLACAIVATPTRSQRSNAKPSHDHICARDPAFAADVIPAVCSADIAENTQGISSSASPAQNPPRQPESLFDDISHRSSRVVSTVEVRGGAPGLQTSTSFHAGGQQIISAAGSFGDVSRFLQTFPGVAAINDVSNGLFVRGGDPMENLFVVDGVQVPNLNVLATLGTTGGFGSMIDSAAIQSVSFYTGDYEAKYPERLSSVISIRTLEPKAPASHSEGDFGIQGLGGLAEIPVRGSDLLLSGHQGLLNLLDGFGIGTLPSYTNELARLRRTDDRGNRLTVLQLGGRDSIRIAPCPGDAAESSTIQSQYSGWRETTAVEWQQVYSKSSFGVVNFSDSEQVDHIAQKDQLLDPTHLPAKGDTCALPPSAPPPELVYTEDTNTAFDTAGYRFDWSRSKLTVTAGSAFWLQRPQYRIDQPLGVLSPYSTAPVRADSTSFSSNFSTGESGTYTEMSASPVKGLVLSAGARLQSFALGNHSTLTPRLSLLYNFGEYLRFHAALASYAQMPPFVYLLSFAQNRSLLPMRATHEVAGIEIGPVLASRLRIEAYEKTYRDVPASTEYPAVNLHDQVDSIGQQFVWLPMDSGGRGRSSGIEVSDTTRLGSRFIALGSVAYSRAMFAGHDGVMRPANVDLPWIANLAALQRLGRGYEISSRFAYTTGRPYSPFNLSESQAQNRGVYDTARMNALRARDYARLDVQMNKDFLLRNVHMELYLGVNNILNRANFLGYVWLPRAKVYSWVNPVYEIDQMPIFPNFGLRYIFR